MSDSITSATARTGTVGTGATGHTWPATALYKRPTATRGGRDPRPCEIKGKVPDLYVSLKPGRQPSEEVRKRVESSVIREIGPIARPRRVVIVPDMPKTRSGKIMRRVLAAISNNEDAGDISTLANPEIVDEIRKMKF
jgi:hypothetical protein